MLISQNAPGAYRLFGFVASLLTALFLWFALPGTAVAKVTALKQSIAQEAARDADIAAFYKANNFQTIWVGNTGRERTRRAQLLRFLSAASNHGLPVSRYDPEGLKAKMKAARTPSELGQLEVEQTARLLDLRGEQVLFDQQRPRSTDRLGLGDPLDGCARRIDCCVCELGHCDGSCTREGER